MTAPRDLTLTVRFHVRDRAEATPTDDTFPFVQFKLTVRDVSLGPSEIELDDKRAEVEGCRELQRHLSITSLTQRCHDSLCSFIGVCCCCEAGWMAGTGSV